MTDRRSSRARRATPFPRVASRLVLAPVLILAFTACTSGESSRATASVRDSAGISIVEHPAEVQATDVARLRAVEAVSIGAVEGDERQTFNRISDLAVGPEGRLHVLDSGDRVVKVYDSDGTYLHAYGGEGEGPGEFLRPSILIPLGDSMGVFDYRNRKVARFAADGSLLATRPFTLSVFEVGFPSQLEPVPGGLVGVFGSGCSMPPPDDLRPTWKVLALGLGGTVRDTVNARFRRDLLAIYGERFCTSIPALAGAGYELAVRPDGVAAFTDGRSYEIHILHLAAAEESEYEGALPRPERIVRRALEPAPVTDVQEDEYRSRWIPDPDPEDARTRDRRTAITEALDTTATPETHPRVANLLWDDRARLWVGREVVGDAAWRIWDVYDGEGGLVAEIELPTELTVRVVVDDRVWGIERDDLGVMYVKGYRTSNPGTDGTAGGEAARIQPTEALKAEG